jgi:hypothetical protein
MGIKDMQKDSTIVLHGTNKSTKSMLEARRELKEGFGTYCPPGICFWFYATVDKKGKGKIFNTIPLIKELVPQVTSETDAIFYSQFINPSGSINFPDLNKPWQGKIKKISTGYLMIVNRRTSDCPVTFSDILVFVDTTGNIKILDKKVTRSTGICY